MSSVGESLTMRIRRRKRIRLYDRDETRSLMTMSQCGTHLRSNDDEPRTTRKPAAVSQIFGLALFELMYGIDQHDGLLRTFDFFGLASRLIYGCRLVEKFFEPRPGCGSDALQRCPMLNLLCDVCSVLECRKRRQLYRKPRLHEHSDVLYRIMTEIPQ